MTHENLVLWCRAGKEVRRAKRRETVCCSLPLIHSIFTFLCCCGLARALFCCDLRCPFATDVARQLCSFYSLLLSPRVRITIEGASAWAGGKGLSVLTQSRYADGATHKHTQTHTLTHTSTHTRTQAPGRAHSGRSPRIKALVFLTFFQCMAHSFILDPQ